MSNDLVFFQLNLFSCSRIRSLFLELPDAGSPEANEHLVLWRYAELFGKPFESSDCDTCGDYSRLVVVALSDKQGQRALHKHLSGVKALERNIYRFEDSAITVERKLAGRRRSSPGRRLPRSRRLA